MSKKFFNVAVIALSLVGFVSTASAATGWWDADPWKDPERGFNWYPPDTPPKKKEEPKKEEPKKEEPPVDITKLKTVPEVKKEAERLRDVAIMEPTPENILTYLKANKFLMDKSAVFTDMTQRVTWQNPAVDYNAFSPQANFAQLQIKNSNEASDEALIRQLAQTHGMLFFYRSDCEYCHIQAPIMSMLQKVYGLEVMAISGDGGPMQGFPDAKPDNGISTLVTGGRGISMYPATYLVSKDQKQVVPLGSGVMALDELINRVRVLVTTKPGDRF